MAEPGNELCSDAVARAILAALSPASETPAS
jgi:hypothetical protein